MMSNGRQILVFESSMGIIPLSQPGEELQMAKSLIQADGIAKFNVIWQPRGLKPNTTIT